MTTPANVWAIPRESKEFVGPIAITTLVNGSPVTIDSANLEFAVLPVGTRPTEDDWTDPVDDPDPDSDGIGVQADPVDDDALLGIWAQIVDAPNVPVLEPSQVGFLRRT